MSWNHFVDNEIINTDGTYGQTLSQGSPEQSVIEGIAGESQVTEKIQEGMTGMENSKELYEKLLSDIKMLLIYFAIFLGGLFLGGPILFYYFLLAGSNYFPDKPGDVLENNDLTKPMASTFLKLRNLDGDTGDVRHFQIFLDKKLYSNSILYGPSFPDEDGNVGSGYNQWWFVRYLYGYLSYSLIYYFKFSSIISNCIGPKGIVYFILFIVTSTIITIVSLVQKDPDTNIVNKAVSLLAPNVTGIYFFYPIMIVTSIVAGCFMLLAPLKQFAGNLGTTEIISVESAYKPTQLFGGDWKTFGGALARYFCIILLFILGLSIGPAIIPLFMMGFIGYCLFTPSGCYILETEKITLNIFGAYKLFWVYCTTCVPYFLEIIFLVFVIIACLIDTEKGSKIQFGAWVAGITFILWLLNFRKFIKFRIEYIKYLNNLADRLSAINNWFKDSLTSECTNCKNVKIADDGSNESELDSKTDVYTNTKGVNTAYNEANESYRKAIIEKDEKVLKNNEELLKIKKKSREDATKLINNELDKTGKGFRLAKEAFKSKYTSASSTPVLDNTSPDTSADTGSVFDKVIDSYRKDIKEKDEEKRKNRELMSKTVNNTLDKTGEIIKKVIEEKKKSGEIINKTVNNAIDKNGEIINKTVNNAIDKNGALDKTGEIINKTVNNAIDKNGEIINKTVNNAIDKNGEIIKNAIDKNEENMKKINEAFKSKYTSASSTPVPASTSATTSDTTAVTSPIVDNTVVLPPVPVATSATPVATSATTSDTTAVTSPIVDNTAPVANASTSVATSADTTVTSSTNDNTRIASNTNNESGEDARSYTKEDRDTLNQHLGIVV